MAESPKIQSNIEGQASDLKASDLKASDLKASDLDLNDMAPSLPIELGDIVEIRAENNDEFHEQVFIITYIDETKLRLFNVATRQHSVLHIDTATHKFMDESISGFQLLSRSEEKGYARQNGLLTHVWVDIHFAGEIPAIVTGEITNVEEDCIEITKYPDLTVFYLDFEYKGIPEDIPIDRIVIRDKPAAMKNLQSILDIQSAADEGEEQATIEFMDTGESIIHIPENATPDVPVDAVLEKLYQESTEIVETELDDVVQYVEVPEHKKRFGIDFQRADMLDQLLAATPEHQRTPKTMSYIHLLIERYTQLREEFSHIDTNGTVNGAVSFKHDYKPLVQTLSDLLVATPWIIPVANVRRQIFSGKKELGEDANEENTGVYDIELRAENEVIGAISNADSQFRNNQTDSDSNHYQSWIRQVSQGMIPYSSPEQRFARTKLLATRNPHVPTETVLDTLDDFYSSAYLPETGRIGKRRFLFQRHDVPLTFLEKTGNAKSKAGFVPTPIFVVESVPIQSVLVLPEPIVHYYRAHLVGTNILERTNLALQPFYKYRVFHESQLIPTTTVIDLDTPIDYEQMETDTTERGKEMFLSSLRHYVLDESVAKDDGTFSRFLNAIVPQTKMFIRLMRNYMHDKFTFHDVVSTLESFGILTKHITFTQYLEIRYSIKNHLAEYKKKIEQRRKSYLAYAKMSPHPLVPVEKRRIHSTFRDNGEMNDWFLTAYRFSQPAGKTAFETATTGELLNTLLYKDGAQLYAKLTQFLMLPLISADNILDKFIAPKLEDMTEKEQIRAAKCATLVLAKRYTSVGELQKDNNVDVFFDKGLDDTPYDIAKKYSAQKREMLPERFVAFLAENLVQKHDCPPAAATELANTLIQGKKLVKEGEYAMLTIPVKVDVIMDEKTTELASKVQYYKRMSNVWVLDEKINETMFVDTSSLFCNLEQSCYFSESAKKELGDKCAPNETAAMRMKNATRTKMVEEFDRRVALTMQEVEMQLASDIDRLKREIVKKSIYRELQDTKYNEIAYHLGKQLVLTNDNIYESPYVPLRNKIMAEPDFVVKQHNIVRFVQVFTRRPMKNALEESEHWLYCEKTNMKLFPMTHARLAETYVQSPDSYADFLEKMCDEYGKEEGNRIVDKHTGWELRKLDFAADDEYDDAGFKIKSHAIMQKELSQLVADAIFKRDRVFTDETTRKIYNVFFAICSNVGLQQNEMETSLEELVLRISLELFNNKNATVVMSEDKYNRRMEKTKEKQGKIHKMTYQTYCDQLLVLLTACSTLISIQGMIPSFKTRKTFPGCIQSFRGFPLDSGVENVDGIKYIACILHKIRTDISPWKSIAPLSADKLTTQMTSLIQDFFVSRSDIQNMFVQKREYLQLYPDETIDPMLAVSQRWVHYQPPLVHFTTQATAQGVGDGYEQELVRAMRDKSQSQFQMIGLVQAKMFKVSYAIVELIRNTVREKDALLLTAAKVAFLDNACCNETNLVQPYAYFLKENPELDVFFKKFGRLANITRMVAAVSRGPMVFHNTSTANVYPVLPVGIEADSVYRSIIYYCHFDSKQPIPREYLPVCSAKPTNYNSHWSLAEKIEALRSDGKNYTKQHLDQLMTLVNNRNLISPVYSREVSQINQFKDVLEHMELSTGAHSIHDHLRTAFWEAVGEYAPGVMVAEPRDSLLELKRVLQRANVQMSEKIVIFLDKYANVSPTEFRKLESFVNEFGLWNLDVMRDTTDLHTAVQYVKNTVHHISRNIPSKIISQRQNVLQLQHPVSDWNFAKDHYDKLNGTAIDQMRPFLLLSRNEPLVRITQESRNQLTELVSFVQSLPVFSPIIKAGTTYYSLFDAETVMLTLSYCWYFAVHTYINIAYNQTPNTIAEKDDDDAVLDDVVDLDADDTESAVRLTDAVKQGDRQEIREQAGTLVKEMVLFSRKSKEMVDIPYTAATESVSRTKLAEKRTITKYFEDMGNYERKVEYMLKQYKLGRWSEGLKSSVHKYNKKAYESVAASNAEYENILFSNTTAVENTEPGQTADELDADEEIRANLDAEGEANDISHFGEEYMDGNYYGDEDSDDEFLAQLDD